MGFMTPFHPDFYCVEEVEKREVDSKPVLLMGVRTWVQPVSKKSTAGLAIENTWRLICATLRPPLR